MHKRREFSAATKREAFKRSGGICECHRLAARGIPGFSIEGCGRPNGAGNIFYEHIHCENLTSDSSLENCAVLTKTCWHIKTNTYDKPTIAKANRVRDRARNIKTQSHRPLPGTRRSGWKHRMDGTWERRHG